MGQFESTGDNFQKRFPLSFRIKPTEVTVRDLELAYSEFVNHQLPASVEKNMLEQFNRSKHRDFELMESKTAAEDSLPSVPNGPAMPAPPEVATIPASHTLEDAAFSVSVDEIARIGSVASGQAILKDGRTAQWQLDLAGGLKVNVSVSDQDRQAIELAIQNRFAAKRS